YRLVPTLAYNLCVVMKEGNVSRTDGNLVIDAEVAKSWTLPANIYVDPAVLEREKKVIFSRTWQIVGRREQVSKAGDYFTTEVAGEPLLLVRGQNGELRGFYNVC